MADEDCHFVSFKEGAKLSTHQYQGVGKLLYETAIQFDASKGVANVINKDLLLFSLYHKDNADHLLWNGHTQEQGVSQH